MNKLLVRFQFPIGANTARLEIFGETALTGDDFRDMEDIVKLFTAQFDRKEAMARATGDAEKNQKGGQ